MGYCEHKHQTGNLMGQWWCKDCGKCTTGNAKDRKLEINSAEIYQAMNRTFGYLKAYEAEMQYQFANEIIKLCKELHHE